MNLIDRITDLNLKLPPAPKPVGVYKPILVVDNFLYISGQGPINNDGSLITGKVGSDLNKKEAKLAARQVGLTMLSTMANKLDYNFIDVDKMIEIDAGKTIKKIFEEDGEEYFRDLEEKITLKRLIK